MKIEEIRSLSLEYAKGTFARPARRPRGNKLRHRKETYAEWFARSLENGKRAGPPPRTPKVPDKQLDNYKCQDPGDDGKPPW
jgi:hypothetical protein